MSDREEYILNTDKGTVGLQVVNVATEGDPTAPGVMYDPDSGEILEVVQEWVTIRCACGATGRINKPAESRQPGRDGIYRGICPRCAAGTILAEPLNREQRRRKARRN